MAPSICVCFGEFLLEVGQVLVENVENQPIDAELELLIFVLEVECGLLVFDLGDAFFNKAFEFVRRRRAYEKNGKGHVGRAFFVLQITLFFPPRDVR